MKRRRYTDENNQANQPAAWPKACKAHKGQWLKNRNPDCMGRDFARFRQPLP